MRLGDNKIIPIDIRVIAATNKNLEQLVQSGQFRIDLYSRLYVLQLNLPPLRERREDIPILAENFISQFGGSEGANIIQQLSQKDYQLLQAQPWQGNIRELRNFCERLAVLFQPGDNVSELILRLLGRAAPIHPVNFDPVSVSTGELLDMNNSEKVLRTIRDCGGNKTRAAAKLGISRVTLWRLLKRIEEGDV